MAISIVQSNFTPTHFGSAASETFTCSLTNPVTSGNAIAIGFGGNDFYVTTKTPGTVTDNQSNTYAQQTYNVTDNQGWWLLTNITNGPQTFSVPMTAGAANQWYCGVAVYEISGLLASPTDYTNTIGTSFATNFTMGFTTVAANELALVMLSNSNSLTTWTPTSGFTTDYSDMSSGGTYNFALSRNILTASGSQTFSGTTAGNSSWYGTFLTLEVASAPPPVSPPGPMPRQIYVMP
jgi:hypothetical protein